MLSPSRMASSRLLHFLQQELRPELQNGSFLNLAPPNLLQLLPSHYFSSKLSLLVLRSQHDNSRSSNSDQSMVTSTDRGASGGAETAGLSSSQCGWLSFKVVHGEWKAREITKLICRLRRDLAAIHCSMRFNSSPSSYWFPRFAMKTVGFQNTLFEANCQNFDSWSLPNEILFLGNDLKLLIVTKNHFQWYIICLYLMLFAQSYIFWEKLWKCQFKDASFYV